MDAAIALRQQIAGFGNNWPPDRYTVESGSSPGGVVFTPKAQQYDRPPFYKAECCEAVIIAFARHLGYAPTGCTCEDWNPETNWKFLVGDLAWSQPVST
jgi:hypothetical protein